MIINYLGSCHFMQKCDLTCLNMLPMLMIACAMPMFVFYALVSSLSVLNSTFGTIFMLVTSPN
jgi:hypothetical protein